jgi:Tol biopolymer transport system component
MFTSVCVLQEMTNGLRDLAQAAVPPPEPPVVGFLPPPFDTSPIRAHRDDAQQVIHVSEQRRWRDISRLYYEALQTADGARGAFLDVQCAGDDALREEVVSLLACHSAAAGLMAAPELTADTCVADEAAMSPGLPIIGRHLGSYRIESRLGAGGMGEVYRATDVRLQRSVALKILPRHLRQDRYLRERLEREALAVAALRHPHICVLHDIGVHEDIEFIVMEYLEGQTLAARLTRGPLPIGEALTCANEIAGALVETHRHGVVHGDLKPANIMLTAAGAKLLDYGLATRPLAVPVRVSSDQRGTLRLPAIAGTLPYMTPEQLQGIPADARTDVYAFGAILYEMITGRQAFAAATRAGVAGAILTGPPPSMPASVEPEARVLEPVIRRCLARDPQDRFQQTTDLVTELARLTAFTSSESVASPLKRRLAMIAAGVIALTALGAAAAWNAGLVGGDRQGSSGAGRTGPPLAIGNMRQVTSEDRLEIDPAVSPDGKLVAYSAGTSSRMSVFVRSLSGGVPTAVASDGGPVQFQPQWSPDGRQLLYLTPDAVFLWPVGGGAPRRVEIPDRSDRSRVADRPEEFRVSGATWSPHGDAIAVAHDRTMTIVPLDGTEPRLLPFSSPDELHHCNWSPNRQVIACASGNWISGGVLLVGNLAPSAILLVAADGSTVVDATDRRFQHRSPTFGPDGTRLYFVSNQDGPGDVYSIDISPQGTIAGAPVRVTTGLGAYSIAFTRDGKRLAYSAYSSRANVWSLPVPEAGPIDTSAAQPVTTGNQVIEAMIVSPDEKWLLFDSTRNGSSDIFRVPIGGGPVEQLTTHPGDEFAPELSHDGRMLVYFSWRTKSRDVFVKPLPGGSEEQVTDTPSQESYTTWSPDGQFLLFFDQARPDGAFVGWFTVRRDAGGRWGTPVHTGLPRDAASVMWMPGGQGLVYSRAGGIERADSRFGSRRLIYRPDPARGDPSALSLRPSADGGTIYFKTIDDSGRASFWSLPIAGGRPERLVHFHDLARASSRWEFTVAGGRFYFTIEERRGNIWIADVTER